MKTMMAMAALTLMLIVPGVAQAATFSVCIRSNIQTTDSGQTANGIDEDYYSLANQPGGEEVVGRGFRVRITQGTWGQTFDSDPTSGCFSFARDSSTGFTVRVYGFATDSDGNSIRIHDAGTDTSSWYPGNTYSAVWNNQSLSSVATNTYVLDGLANDRFTAITAAAFGLHRIHGPNANKTISIGFTENDCDNSGSTHGSAEQYIESNDAHLIRIGRCSPGDPDSREKMIITHEMGHAMLRMYYGYDGDDLLPTSQQEYVPRAGTPSACVNVGSYGMRSLEWSSQTFKEAFADFYSSRVWNGKDARGTYTYRQTAYDLEQWDTAGGPNTEGGVKVNVCGNNTDNVGTKGDWLRFLWDWFTAACASQPSDIEMFELYRMVRENSRTGVYPLTYTNFDDAVRYTIDNSIGGLTTCEKDFVDEAMTWNRAD